jgi:YD repeat-containing protein
MAWRTYTQSYEYDAVGNIEEMRHQAPGGNWTSTYAYEGNTNRLVNTQAGGQTYDYPHHASHGFMTEMPHLSMMRWNFKDELQATARQAVNTGTPETTYYVYDGSGQRVRKITENASSTGTAATIREERIYLGGTEIFRRHSGNNSGLERRTLHVSDDSGRIAMVDTRNEINDDTDVLTIRYQMSNHLGSAALETDENAEIISYEEYHP